MTNRSFSLLDQIYSDEKQIKIDVASVRINNSIAVKDYSSSSKEKKNKANLYLFNLSFKIKSHYRRVKLFYIVNLHRIVGKISFSCIHKLMPY
jgi:hypothetical protein